MSDLLRQVTRVATRTLKNRCFLCLGDVRKGHSYVEASHADGGRVYSLYEHEICREIFTEYMDDAWGDSWEYSEGDLLDVLDELPEDPRGIIRRLRDV